MIPAVDNPALRAAAMAALALALAVGLSACGRKGPLDPPPGAQVVEPGSPGPRPQVDSEGRQVAPAGVRRRILLDAILD